MVNTWETIHIRIRSDQKEALNKTYPDNLARGIRDLIDKSLKLQKPDKIILEELTQIKNKNNKSVALLQSKKEKLIQESEKRDAELKFKTLRDEYIENKPRVLLDFSRNRVTQTGYSIIQSKLHFDSVKDLKIWLNKTLTKAKESPDWEKHLIDMCEQTKRNK